VFFFVADVLLRAEQNEQDRLASSSD